MRKKVEERLVPFFKLHDAALKSYIRQLPPQQIGEIRQLCKIKKQELSEQLLAQLRGSNTEEEYRRIEKRGKLFLAKIKKNVDAFDEVFTERQQIKQRKLTRETV